jgi:hypothetical protein
VQNRCLEAGCEEDSGAASGPRVVRAALPKVEMSVLNWAVARLNLDRYYELFRVCRELPG